jgi:hypothetical protein
MGECRRLVHGGGTLIERHELGVMPRPAARETVDDDWVVVYRLTGSIYASASYYSR